ncbi:MAG: hypothetical protein RIB59_11460 [Rhodospirillales bacterium]
MSLRIALRTVSDSAFGDRLKTALGLRAPKLVRPLSKAAAVSDLFPWRVDETWDTRFDVINIPSILFPEAMQSDAVTLYIFNANGKQTAKHRVNVPPATSVSLSLREMTESSAEYGCFACFHSATDHPELTTAGTMIADRNYVSFRRKDDSLWSYVHGNANALAETPGGALTALTGRPAHSYVYRPQIEFDDCRRFELIYINPLDRDARLSVCLLNADRTEIMKLDNVIPPRGVRVIPVDNNEHRCHMIENHGNVPDWRPTIFKFYDSHFDVLHS